MKKVITLVSILCLMATGAMAQTVVDYGWEDGGDYIGLYGNVDAANTYASTDMAHTGDYGLMVTEGAGGGTPQVLVAAIYNLQDGDVVTAGFWRYDTTPSASPSLRVWGHWNDDLPDDLAGYSGSASGNSDYGLGEGWDYTDYVYTVADGHTGLMIECRLYASEGVSQFIDDLHIEAPDHAYILIPGDGGVANESQTWGQVKSLFR